MLGCQFQLEKVQGILSCTSRPANTPIPAATPIGKPQHQLTLILLVSSLINWKCIEFIDQVVDNWHLTILKFPLSIPPFIFIFNFC